MLTYVYTLDTRSTSPTLPTTCDKRSPDVAKCPLRGKILPFDNCYFNGKEVSYHNFPLLWSLMFILAIFCQYGRRGGWSEGSPVTGATLPGMDSASPACLRTPKSTGFNKRSNPTSLDFFGFLTESMRKSDYMISNDILLHYLMNTFPPLIIPPSGETRHM